MECFEVGFFCPDPDRSFFPDSGSKQNPNPKIPDTLIRPKNYKQKYNNFKIIFNTLKYLYVKYGTGTGNTVFLGQVPPKLNLIKEHHVELIP